LFVSPKRHYIQNGGLGWACAEIWDENTFTTEDTEGTEDERNLPPAATQLHDMSPELLFCQNLFAPEQELVAPFRLVDEESFEHRGIAENGIAPRLGNARYAQVNAPRPLH
jgi:hypothetical protein